MSAVENYIGPSAPILVSERPGWSRTTGDYIEKVWEGTQAQIYGLTGDLRTYAESYDFDQKGPLWTARARFAKNPDAPDGEEPQQEIRIQAHRMGKSIWEPWLFPTITDTERQKIKNAVQTAKVDFDVSSLSAQGITLYWLALNLVDHKIVYQPVVLSTWTSSRGYKYPFVFANVGLVLTTAQMTSEVGIASDDYPLPDFTFDNSANELPVDFTYGWLKHPPEVAIVVGSKRSVSAQYEYGLWPDPIYQHA